MRIANVGVVLAVMALPVAGVAAGPGLTLLSANFDDKAIDQPIGIGGASVGEPVQVDGNVVAIVRDTPTTTPSLEIADADDFASGTVRFELENNLEVVDGILTIDVDLWFDTLDSYVMYVREPSFSVHQFLSLRFDNGGSVAYGDAAGSGGTIGSYETGRPYPVHVAFDMDAGTYDVWLDGKEVVTGRAHGITKRGVGAVLIGLNSDVNLEGSVYVDNLIAIGVGVTPAESRSWGDVKAAFLEK